jgi:sec-independent protein translocase protein TatB
VPGFQELLVIAVVALLVFGPDRLPEVARTAGRWLGRFRAETQRNVDELKRMGEIQQLQEELRGLRQEMDGTRSSLQQPMRDLVDGRPGDRAPRDGTIRPGAGRGGTGTAAGRVGGGPGVPLRADDQPAPSDPDAT